MTERQPKLDLDFHPQRRVEVTFDAPETSSDGGLLLLRQADDRLGLSQWFAACLPDERHSGRVVHSRIEQVRQRIYQIAMGYEDCNDADHLRHDPVLKTVCDRLVEDAAGLSSQPTLSRFENAVDARALKRLTAQFEQTYVDSLPASTQVVVLDIDSTDDPTHGSQQLSFFHGFYDQHMYHPLLVFDGETGALISMLLRPGKAHAGRSAWSVLRRVIDALKTRFPQAQIVVRGDSAFCLPDLVLKLEQLEQTVGGVDYLFGLAKNSVLLDLAKPTLELAREQYEQTRSHVRRFTSFSYAAKTWPRQRHVIVKAEHGSKGSNPRFILTSLTEFEPSLIYDLGYCARGQCENYIKDFKNALRADRLSCHLFVPNAFRLLLHGAAYRLLHALRTAAVPHHPDLGKAQFDTLRLKLLKVAAHVTQTVRRIVVRLPEVFPLAHVFRSLCAHFAPQATAPS